MVTAKASMAVLERCERIPSGLSVPICRWGVSSSIRSRNPIPNRKPMAAGRKASFPICSLFSRAGCSRLQKEAATITPAAKPVSAFCTLEEICFFRKKTIAAPRLVPRNGIRMPSAIWMLIVMPRLNSGYP